MVGMSRWSVASALSFYNKEEPMDIRSRNMFGQNAAMYDFWYPSEPPTTRPIILVGMKPHQLEHDIAGVDDITPALVQPGPVKELALMRDGKPLRHYIIVSPRGIIRASRRSRQSTDRVMAAKSKKNRVKEKQKQGNEMLKILGKTGIVTASFAMASFGAVAASGGAGDEKVITAAEQKGHGCHDLQ